MSYAASAALQQALFAKLTADPALVGVPVYDVQPSGMAAPTFVLIGPEDVSDMSDGTAAGAEHRLVVSVMSTAAGFLAAKQIGVILTDSLVQGPWVLAVGRVVSVQFLKAVAKRMKGSETRRIDLTFRVRIDL